VIPTNVVQNLFGDFVVSETFSGYLMSEMAPMFARARVFFEEFKNTYASLYLASIQIVFFCASAISRGTCIFTIKEFIRTYILGIPVVDWFDLILVYFLGESV
jgi:hypothetical protein